MKAATKESEITVPKDHWLVRLLDKVMGRMPPEPRKAGVKRHKRYKVTLTLPGAESPPYVRITFRDTVWKRGELKHTHIRVIGGELDGKVFPTLDNHEKDLWAFFELPHGVMRDSEVEVEILSVWWGDSDEESYVP